MFVWPCSYLKDTVLHVITSIRSLDLFTVEITLHANIKITMTHIIRLQEDYSLIKVVAMVTKSYAPKKNIDS